jgi:hypothetical protein
MRFADEPAERTSSRQATRFSDTSLRPTNRPTGEKSVWEGLFDSKPGA